ncbi:permease [Maricaulis sp. W15]|uniref:EamA family transporter RarD n=1 Tax=Maricaulis sp. W15 TaxID=1772333 RepID=UPI000949044D|nr:EamA family transporter RarD [Maricaulis sp. W15]OLF75544.1 permease [Maricaulis sp. W15]
MSTDTSHDMRRALAAGLSGYLIWGVAPLFFQTLDFASALEIILHRVIWAVPLLAGSLALSGRLRAALGVLADRRTLLTLLATSSLISVNWWGFIYAVNSGHVLQASLGYYINPLMSVAVGVIILREPLGPWRIAAISLAALGVANQILTVGEVPWISLMLATTFTAYGYLRKVAAVDGRVGLLWETLFMLPFALIAFAWLQTSGAGHFLETPLQTALLVAAGAVTVIPLLLYTIGVRGLRLSTMGLLQFIAPTLQFSIGVMSGETFETGHLITFAFIWAGVGCFTWSQIRRERKLEALAEET